MQQMFDDQQNLQSFALKLYQKLRTQNEHENLIFSPYSLYISLSLMALGANRQTLEQFKSLLNFKEPSFLLQEIQQLQQSLQDQFEGVSTEFCSRIYQDIDLVEEFKQQAEILFPGIFYKADFRTSHESIRQQINDWVESQTNNKIQELLPQNSLNPFTRLIIVNALYFKGDWTYKFKESKTKKKEFELLDRSKVEVEMMKLTRDLNYGENEWCQFVQLPYKGQNFTMNLILPNFDIGFQEFEQKYLNIDLINQALKEIMDTKVKLYLPKFKIFPKQNMELKEICKQLGLVNAFDEGKADFSKMDIDNSIFISDIVHKAMIEVNEKGTEAATTTAVVCGRESCIIPVDFNLNRPFIYFISNLEDNSILFMGKVVDPSKN